MRTFEAVSVPSHRIISIRPSVLTVLRYERTSKLGRRGAHDRNEACGVDNAPAGVQSKGLVDRVLAHREDRVLASPPDALDIDLHREVPDALLGIKRVVVLGMHDA